MGEREENRRDNTDTLESNISIHCSGIYYHWYLMMMIDMPVIKCMRKLCDILKI